MESGDKSPSEQQSPFWESAQAPQSAASPQPEAQSVSPPQAQMVGNIGQQQSIQFSATVNNPALNGNIGSASSITTGYDMSEKKKGMNWGQFAIGFFAPIVILMLLSFISEVADDNWDDRWDEVYRTEMITMSSDDGIFTHTFDEEVTDNGRFEVRGCYSLGEYGEYEYHCRNTHSGENFDYEIIETKRNDWEHGMVVGEYTQHNRTIWFSTDSHNSNEMEFEFEFYDRALEEELEEEEYMDGGGDMVDSFFCLMPLIGIVAIIVSFAKGNKSLGFGLVSSMSIPFILGGLFLMLLLMFGF